MPIYEYRCESCGTDVEKLQKISDPPLQDCPACGKATLVKRVSASSFRLKGSGWYETDFKTGKKKNGAADAAGDTGEGPTKPDSAAANSGSDAADKAAQSDKGSGKESGKEPGKSASSSAVKQAGTPAAATSGGASAS